MSFLPVGSSTLQILMTNRHGIFLHFITFYSRNARKRLSKLWVMNKHLCFWEVAKERLQWFTDEHKMFIDSLPIFSNPWISLWGRQSQLLSKYCAPFFGAFRSSDILLHPLLEPSNPSDKSSPPLKPWKFYITPCIQSVSEKLIHASEPYHTIVMVTTAITFHPSVAYWDYIEWALILLSYTRL